MLTTFSITARCPRTGMLGIAVSTRLPAVGALCPYLRAAVGAISSQALVSPFLGLRGLDFLGQGMSAAETLERLVADDPGRDLRQLAVVDHGGGGAAHTGQTCETWSGHRVGAGYVVAGNFLAGETVLPAMEEAFASSEALELPERLMQALEAGQAAGGDRRGKQSAALRVVWVEPYPYVDLRVDDHHEPTAELRRLYELYKQQLRPFLDLLPTTADPSGVTDLEVIRATARRRQQTASGDGR